MWREGGGAGGGDRGIVEMRSRWSDEECLTYHWIFIIVIVIIIRIISILTMTIMGTDEHGNNFNGNTQC